MQQFKRGDVVDLPSAGRYGIVLGQEDSDYQLTYYYVLIGIEKQLCYIDEQDVFCISVVKGEGMMK